jgi:CRP-like cAMP-binding protein
LYAVHQIRADSEIREAGQQSRCVKIGDRRQVRKGAIDDVVLFELSRADLARLRRASPGAASALTGEIIQEVTKRLRSVDEKIERIHASGAPCVVLGDLGCMLNIEGRLRRTGDTTTRVLHVAQVLAGDVPAQEA